MKRIVTTLCALAVIMVGSIPAMAAEEPPRQDASYYPISVDEYTYGELEEPRINKVYQLSLSDDPSLIPTEDFERDGLWFTLLDMTRKNEVGVDTQPYTETVTRPSKNTALIPPTFGSPTSYLPGTGTPLTPNLIPGALTGGGLVTQTGGVTYPTVGGSPGGNSGAGSAATGWTDVTGDLYYSGGHLGTLKIPAIGLSTKVYQGTGSSVLAKGAGHFLDTSIWAGNVCIAGHNRGVRDDFGDLHTLEPGDTVTWTTKLGTRTYEVVSVQKVLETDTSGTTATSDDRLTLYTCVRDQREYRWCVTAVAK